MRRSRANALVVALTAVGLIMMTAAFSLSSGAAVPAAALPVAAGLDTGAFTANETITRDHLNADGTDDVVDTRNFTVNVDRTLGLRGNQELDVSWTGAHPTGGLESDESSTDAATHEEYPVVVMECRGIDSAAAPASEQLNPTTCWTQTSSERYFPSFGTAFPIWRLDRYASVADRGPYPGQPNPLDTSCYSDSASRPPAARWVPFVAADGSVYNAGYDSGTCPSLAPEATNTENSGAPGNTTYGVTRADGAGSTKFVVWTEDQNASLGCSQTVPCSMVVIPIMGVSCDATATGLPTADQPPADQVSADDANCRTQGVYGPGVSASPSQTDPAVVGDLWWTASNWRNRITVPLGFATTSSVCNVVSSSSVVLLYGSPPMAAATQQWAPAFCTDPTKFAFRHVQTGEPAAKNLLGLGLSNTATDASSPSPSSSATGAAAPTVSASPTVTDTGPPSDAGTASNAVEAALESDPPPDGFTLPTVQAPVAVTGFAISYAIDDSQGREYTQLKLTPRLLAKLMTESYPDIPNVYVKYPALAHNPVDITHDPEFIALNPDIPTGLSGRDAASTLYSLSGDSDTMLALTSYINADPEARAWLNGTPDPWGMVVNPNYKGIALPIDSWPLLDSFIADFGHQGANNCIDDNPVPFLPLVASPTSTLVAIAQALQYAEPLSQTVCVFGGGDTDLGDKLTTGGRQSPGFRFMIGLTSLADAKYYSLDTAQLQTYQVSPDSTARFSSDVGRLFVGPTNAAVLAAAKLAAPDEASGTWPIPYGALRDDPANAGAYPGTMFVYAAIPTAGLPTTDAADFATFLRFAATQGQVPGFGNGQLPPGYAPMTIADGLGDQVGFTLRAATAVANQTGKVPTLLGSDEPSVSAPPPASAAAAPTPSATATHPATGTPGRVGVPAPTVAAPTQASARVTAPAVLPSVSASAATSPSASAVAFSGTMVAHSSVLAGSILPSVLLTGLCALVVAAALRFKVRP
jgi:hypothetical protein